MSIQEARHEKYGREFVEISSSSIIEGDSHIVLQKLPDGFVQCVVTSPPYWGLRDYGVAGQIGLEPQLQQYVDNLLLVFREVKRVLSPTGVLWLNVGDGYTSGNRKYRVPDKKNPARTMSFRPDTPEGLKPKDLLGVPWRLAFALQADGWYLRSDVIWSKPNAMPESVKDRPTRTHEYLFMFTKSEKYYYDATSVKEGGRNRRSVWNINTVPFLGAHFATFPPNLIFPCIISSSKPDDFVLDPFFGSGTVGEVATQSNRKFIGIELNPEYVEIAQNRLRSVSAQHFGMAGMR
ncbi:MAG: site-specific DNA-methyltransferase [Clostridiales Family XIII bacterium]|jgi:site-specific DNA-methyltransferase (adenine-specific)|nr:site-specific DNA-methyltransferase [Clostridiales Family XIII bacterium]